MRQTKRHYNYKYRYGVSEKFVEEMKAKQGSKCAICGKEAALVLDHDHETRKVRALLCNSCNKGLGHFHDKIDLLLKSAIYLNLYGV